MGNTRKKYEPNAGNETYEGERGKMICTITGEYINMVGYGVQALY